jgi:hypothetical protein
VGFLRRLLGGDRDEPSGSPTADATGSGDVEADERRHELEILREEQERMDDLTRRQLRYADYAWTPPAEGGDRRADDADPANASDER